MRMFAESASLQRDEGGFLLFLTSEEEYDAALAWMIENEIEHRSGSQIILAPNYGYDTMPYIAITNEIAAVIAKVRWG